MPDGYILCVKIRQRFGNLISVEVEMEEYMKTAEIFALCMVIAVVSFLGFLVENIWLAATKGFIDNRNMCLPFLIGYGLAIVAIYLMFGVPEAIVLFGKKLVIKRSFAKKIVYFLLIMLCVCLGEIILGKLVEHVCHFYWWDYTRLPLHITRYTSIPTSMAFSLLIIIFMDYMFVPLFTHFKAWDYDKLKNTAGILMICMMWDFVYNAYKMYKSKGLITRWRVDTTNTKLYRLLHQ